uniref:ShKT domain-containing protein n=1 Tax=Caenorhabditis tropicalis TaxID=1561998 RepID=A0A1I7V252_9PELO
MFRVLLLASFIVFTIADIELGCNGPVFPKKDDGSCPATTTPVKDGCCLDGDVYIVTPSTTRGPTTVTSTTTAVPTTTAACKDKLNPATGVSDCPRRAYLCTDPTYKQVMKDQCPKTCGFCSSGPTSSPGACQDKINPNTGTSDCPMKKYLCTDPTYKGLMKDQCPKTCGYC